MTAMTNRLISSLLFLIVGIGAPLAGAEFEVRHPTSAVRSKFDLPPFYEKWIDYQGFPIVSSEKVHDAALREAAYLVDRMLGNRPDIVAALAKAKVRFTVMAPTEFTTDVPEHSHLQPKIYWDKRARGLGATPTAPCVSCGEENLLCYQGDKYSTENILVHELAHAIHEVGMREVDPGFDQRLEAAYDAAIESGKWKSTYAATNYKEYFAEAVQSWFHCNRVDDHQHNHVNSRAALKEYDPAAVEMIQQVFRDNPWVYQRPDRRVDDLEHLAGFDRDSAPIFSWPDRLKDFDAYAWERENRVSE